MTKAINLRVLGATLAGVVCSVPVHAQTVTGAVTGTITDPSGAVLPGAQVVAHNVDTGVDTSATSDSAGLYRISFLPIGRYQLKVRAAGFGEQTIPPLPA